MADESENSGAESSADPGGQPQQSEPKPESAILLFSSTHTAMASEAAIIEGSFWCDMVPRPPDAMTALCGLAIEIHLTDLDGARAALQAAGIAFELYKPEVEAF